jgi:uncharacterized protein YndB with AHSA1/START domain
VPTNRSAEVKASLPSDLEIAFTRTFMWKRSLLFEAWTKPEHVKHWWGCDGSRVVACEMDVRIGGSWHIVLRMPDGTDHSFSGKYMQIVPDERLVYTEQYENPHVGNPEWVTTVDFIETESGSQLTHNIHHRSREARDGHLKAGMESGERQSLRRLDERIACICEA